LFCLHVSGFRSLVGVGEWWTYGKEHVRIQPELEYGEWIEDVENIAHGNLLLFLLGPTTGVNLRVRVNFFLNLGDEEEREDQAETCHGGL
jgi:hypothetical protein